MAGTIFEELPVTFVTTVGDYSIASVSSSPEGAINNSLHFIGETLGESAMLAAVEAGDLGEPDQVMCAEGTARLMSYHEQTSNGATRIHLVHGEAEIPRR